MGWKIHIAPFPGVPAIFDQFEQGFLQASGPRDMAMFERTSDDMKFHAYMLTPAAADAFPNLGGVAWTDAGPEYQQMKGWGLGIGHADAKQHFDLPE